MREIVGFPCVLCRQTITSIFDGVFCLECDGPYHHKCFGIPSRDQAIQPCRCCHGETDPQMVAARAIRLAHILSDSACASTASSAAAGGQALYYFGTIVWIFGVLLIIGNVSRLFPTFSYAGFITTVVGVLFQMVGNGMILDRNRKVKGMVDELRFQTEMRLAVEDANKENVNSAILYGRAVTYLVESEVPLVAAKDNLQSVLAVIPPPSSGNYTDYVFSQTTDTGDSGQ